MSFVLPINGRTVVYQRLKVVMTVANLRSGSSSVGPSQRMFAVLQSDYLIGILLSL